MVPFTNSVTWVRLLVMAFGHSGQRLHEHLHHGGLAVLLVGLGGSRHCLRLGPPHCELGRRLGLTLESYGFGDRGTTGTLRLALLGAFDGVCVGGQFTGTPVGLGGSHGGCPHAFCLRHRGRPLGFGVLLDAVALRVGGLADLHLQLLLGDACLSLGNLRLLGQDLLVASRLRQRSGRLGLGGGCVRLGLDLRLAQRKGAFGDGDLFLGSDPLSLRHLVGLGLRDVGGLANLRGLRATQIAQVGAVRVGDVLDGEGVQGEALAGE